MASRPLKVGSDCTGLNGMALALESLNLPFEEVFASEINAAARALLQRNFKIGRIFEDLRLRPHPQSPKGLDLYCAGFPCQPYSSMGQREGLSTENGNVGLHVLMYIRYGLPKSFLLENVAQLGTAERFRKTLELILNFLTSICGPNGKQFYDLHYKIMNSKDYGTPQNRNRIYIVGLMRQSGSRRRHPIFLWPETEAMLPLSQILDSDPPANPPELPTTQTGLRNYVRCAHALLEQGLSVNADAIGDFGSGFDGRGNVAVGYSPCLTKSRSEQNGYYCFSKRRFLRLSEYFRLQGIPPGRLSLPVGVTEAAARSMIGNSFTVSVVARIIDRMMYAMSLTHRPR
eukprot:s227_g4.t1